MADKWLPDADYDAASAGEEGCDRSQCGLAVRTKVEQAVETFVETLRSLDCNVNAFLIALEVPCEEEEMAHADFIHGVEAELPPEAVGRVHTAVDALKATLNKMYPPA